MKINEILVSTLEGRFKKLHDAANFAEDCIKAIAFHAEELRSNKLTPEQDNIINELDKAVEIWISKFSVLAEHLQTVEAQYFDHLSEDKSKCVLIEEVPTYGKNEIPNTFQMSEKLFSIGFYEMDGDPYGAKTKTYTKEVILTNLQELRLNVVLCIKALANASYNGIWKEVESIVFDIYEFEPNAKIQKLLDLFNVRN